MIFQHPKKKKSMSLKIFQHQNKLNSLFEMHHTHPKAWPSWHILCPRSAPSVVLTPHQSLLRRPLQNVTTVKLRKLTVMPVPHWHIHNTTLAAQRTRGRGAWEPEDQEVCSEKVTSSYDRKARHPWSLNHMAAQTRSEQFQYQLSSQK